MGIEESLLKFQLLLFFLAMIPIFRWFSLTFSIVSSEEKISEKIEIFNITVLLPMRNEARNAPRKIAEVVDEIISHENVSLMVVNSCSTDCTEDIVKRAIDKKGFPMDRFSIISLDKPGKSYAINAALERVTSDLIIMSDADAVISKGWLLRFSEIFSDPEIGVASGIEEVSSAIHGWKREYREKSNMIRIWESSRGSTPVLEGSIIGWRMGLIRDFRLDESLNADDAQITFKALNKGKRAIISEAITFQQAREKKGELVRSMRRSQGLSRVLIGNMGLMANRQAGIERGVFLHAIYFYVFFPWIFTTLLVTSIISTTMIDFDEKWRIITAVFVFATISSRKGRSVMIGSYVSIISHLAFIFGKNMAIWNPDSS